MYIARAFDIEKAFGADVVIGIRLVRQEVQERYSKTGDARAVLQRDTRLFIEHSR
jgi:hypothetical protein